MRTALITGASTGIGREIARQLVDEGFFVFIGSRDLDKGIETMKELAFEGLGTLDVVQIDVTNKKSIDAARKEIEPKIDALDVLINNTGVIDNLSTSFIGYNTDVIKEMFETNYYGPIRVVNAFFDLMKKASRPPIVNVACYLNSLMVETGSANPYCSNTIIASQSVKTVMNIYTTSLAYDLRETNFKVNAVDPGFIVEDFYNPLVAGTIKQVGDCIVKFALIGKDGPSGRFYSGQSYPDDLLRY